jgi:hypothetical protein
MRRRARFRSGSSRDAARSHGAQRLVIPATTLAEFLTGALASHGSIRRAADGIGIPYSTFRGWLRGAAVAMRASTERPSSVP